LFRLAGAVALICCLVACKKKEVKEYPGVKTGFEEVRGNGIPADWLTFKGNGYTIRYPAAFKLDTTGYMKTDVIFYTKLSYNEDEFSDNINVMIQDLKDPQMNLDQFAKLSEDEIKMYVEEPEIIESQRESSNGIEYYNIIYSEKNPNYYLIRDQHLMIRNQKAYVLTLTCEKPLFDQYKETGELVLSSFRFQ